MEKVKSGSITETFKFSRALHLMSNSGERVRFVDGKKGEYLYICKAGGDETLIVCSNGYKAPLEGLTDLHLLGNWEIYREELHGL